MFSRSARPFVASHIDRQVRVCGYTGDDTHVLQLGMPALTAAPPGQVLASTWSGHCLLIDVETAIAESQPPVATGHVGHTLRSPVSTDSAPPFFAVATTAGWAGIWRPGDATAQRLENRFSACNAVALAPDGDLIAIGTGFYPLGSQYPECAIELWTTSERPVLQDWVRLPDVVVDRLYWDADSSMLFAWTGEITQESGHIWRLEVDPLRIIDAAPVGYAGTLCGGRWGDHLVSVGGGSIELRYVDSLRQIVRRAHVDGEPTAAALSESYGTVVLSTGELVELASFERSNLLRLDGCTGIAALPDGAFAGIAGDGRLRIWNPRPSSEPMRDQSAQASLLLDQGPHADPVIAAAQAKWDQDLTRRAIDELFVAARQYRSSAAYAALLSFTVRFRWYAPYNALLVQAQMPGATYVAPAHRWLRDFRRTVRPGARPLVILQPMGPVMFVFDVSDTIPEPDAPPLPREVENPFEVSSGRIRSELQQTIDNATRDGVLVTRAKSGSQAAGEIAITESKRTLQYQRRAHPKPEYVAIPHRYDVIFAGDHSAETRYAALVHELAHLYCGHLGTPDSRWWPDRRFLTRSVEEFEAESVSYLVCRRLGIDTPAEEYLSGYINQHSETPPISLECVTKVAGLIEQMGRGRMPPREERKK
jgi:hypothetical protein